MIIEVKVSVIGFLLSLIVNWYLPLQYPFSVPSYSELLPPLILFLLILLLLPNIHRLNYLTAHCLGLLFLIGLVNCQQSIFGIYLAVLAFFHFAEYVTTGLSNPQNLSWDSYLVNHSFQYGAAMLLSWTEYALWLWFYPDLKTRWFWITILGFFMCSTGEIVRKLAMLHAGRNFNHLVQNTKSDTHKLVTTGIYSICRHPSYLGWFLWSVGSQVLLVNPVCLIIYTAVTFLFFKERIYVEEYTLIAFFGDEYRQYQQRVGSGLPGISGFHGPVLWGEK